MLCRYECVCDDLHPNAYQQQIKELGTKKPHRVLQKNSHPLETTEILCLPPQTPNFNVVIGSAEHYQQKWLFFFEGRQAQNSEDNN